MSFNIINVKLLFLLFWPGMRRLLALTAWRWYSWVYKWTFSYDKLYYSQWSSCLIEFFEFSYFIQIINIFSIYVLRDWSIIVKSFLIIDFICTNDEHNISTKVQNWYVVRVKSNITMSTYSKTAAATFDNSFDEGISDGNRVFLRNKFNYLVLYLIKTCRIYYVIGSAFILWYL